MNDRFDEIIAKCRQIMEQKNHDYADSWKHMRITSITDQIHVKVMRIKRIEDLEIIGEKPQISEGVESEYRDIINYCVFALMKLGY